jgi:nitrite reductase/ring-hydroxylating ferredoxin subunit
MHSSPSPESPERRRFFSRVITTIHTAIGATLGVILGGSILSPLFGSREESWLAAGSLALLPDNRPTPVTIRLAREDGYNQIVERRTVFLVKTGAADVLALDSTCTHLGCRVSWNAETQELICPCHGGVYDATGAVKAGPPPAPLARLATRVDGDLIQVQL